MIAEGTQKRAFSCFLVKNLLHLTIVRGIMSATDKSEAKFMILTSAAQFYFDYYYFFMTKK